MFTDWHSSESESAGQTGPENVNTLSIKTMYKEGFYCSYSLDYKSKRYFKLKSGKPENHLFLPHSYDKLHILNAYLFAKDNGEHTLHKTIT